MAGLLLTVTLLMAGWPASARALSIDGIRFGAHPDKTRLVVDLSEKTDFRAFVLADPYRMVVDLPDFDWQAGAIAKPVGGAVKDVRQGRLKPGVSRIVVDMAGPVVIRSAFILPQDRDHPHRLVLDFSSANQDEFLQYKGRLLGNLDVDNVTPVMASNMAVSSMPQEAGNQAQKTIKTAGGMIVPPHKPPLPDGIPPRTEKPIIVIDPGHGGTDPGAVGANGVFEKHVTLAMAKELKRQLEATGRYTVHLTRDTDTYIRLHKRVAYARKRNADLFVSLHADSIDKSNVRGASIYTLSEKASDAQTERLAARENRADLIAGVDLSVEDETVASILVDLAMRDTMNQSKFLANTMVVTMKSSSVKTLENPHRYAGFAVLKAPDIPSVLVEMGFMSNRQEAQMLNQTDYRRKIAGSLREGIEAYFRKVQKNNNT
ncbi:MAG: N-acetylmuramoyl-L-alanine amidase [Rhodospirillales bacterium]|nr:N-acetylmuramoyl-L-alanine amidase [Rhodospirillales bacterium]